jgi:hypothetical protein
MKIHSWQKIKDIMVALTNLFKAAKLEGALVENQDLLDSDNSNAICHNGFSMYPDEVSSQLEQEFYDRASGCSVKAQENNIYDYRAYLKNE